jgi:hypothetical protein
MRKISLIVLRASSAALMLTAPLVFGAAPANAQAMGEYGTTIGQSAGIGPSSPTLPPPSSYTNPMDGGNNGSTSTIEVNSDDRRDDDSSRDRDDRDAKDANSGDDWSETR